MRALLALTLAACVRQGAVDVTGDGRPDLAVSYDDVIWTSGRGLGSSTLTVPVDVTNLSRRQVIDVHGWDLRVTTADGRACVGRDEAAVRLHPGWTARFHVDVDCGESLEAPTVRLDVQGELRYAVDGVPVATPLAETLELWG